jgi:katanin p60 ATPase-containing subunit A1
MTSVKVKSEVRLQEEQKLEQRKRNCLILVLHHLLDWGYVEAAGKLQIESGINPNDFEVADNVDLLSIVQEYEVYFQMKFNKKPKLTRRKQSDVADAKAKNNRRPTNSYSPSIVDGTYLYLSEY